MNKILNYMLLLALFAFSACSSEVPEQPQPDAKSKVLLSFDFEDINTLRSVATDDEKNVQNIYVFFFDASGNTKTFTNAAGSYKHPFIFYTADNTNTAIWKDAKTVYLPMTPYEVSGLQVYVLANVPDALKPSLATVNSLADLQTKYYQSGLAIAPPLLMDGNKTVPSIAAGTLEYTIPVDLRRAVAKLEINFYFDWEKLDANRDNYHSFNDLGINTWALQKSPLLVSTPTANRGSETSLSLLPKNTVRIGPVKVIKYINEYNQGTDVVNTPPYVLLKLWAHYDQAAETPPAGTYPPPAGGVVDPAKDIIAFYRLLLPREVLRNTHYIIDAHVLQLGGPAADNALTLNPTMTVKPWDNEIDISQ